MPEYYSTTEVVRLGRELGRGGEGSVFEVFDKPESVAKIYHEPISADKSEKLRQMVALQNEKILRLAAWVTDVLRDQPNGRVVGFLMPKVGSGTAIHELYNPQSRRKLFPTADWRFLIHAAANLARAFVVIHSNGHAVGDVNHGNIVIGRDATVRLIDCDSYHLNAPDKSYLCEVGVSTHTPPELQNQSLREIARTGNHDSFGLGVMIFQLLFMGRHPFSGTYQGADENTLENSIQNRRFAYGDGAAVRQMKQPPGTLPLTAVSPQLAKLFERAFLEIENRPTAREWVSALEELEQNLTQCGVNSGHYYWQNLQRCPWCRLEGQTGVLFFPAKYTGNFDANGEFDLYTLGNLIDAIKPPELSQILPAATQTLLVPSQTLPASPVLEESLTKYKFNLSVFLFITAVLVFAFGFIFGFGSVFWMAFAGFWVINEIIKALLQKPLEGAQLRVDAARQKWQSFKEDWSKTSVGKTFEETRNELKEKIKEYRELPRQKEARSKEIESQNYHQSLELYLSRFLLKEAEIFGLNDERLNLLNGGGIKTAAQIDSNSLARVTNLSYAHKGILLEWRKGLEKKYVFNPSLKALKVIKENKEELENEIYLRRAQLETDLRGGLPQLQQISVQLTKKHHDLAAQSDKLAAELSQAESDFKRLGDLKSQAIAWVIGVVIVSYGVGITIRQIEFSEKHRVTAESAESRTGAPAVNIPVRSSGNGTGTNFSELKVIQRVPTQLGTQSTGSSASPADWGKAGELYQNGEQYFAIGNYLEAIVAYKAAAVANPKIARIYNKMGEAYFQLAQHGQAIEAYQKGLKIEPDDSDTWHKLGLVYNKVNSPAEAISAFKRAVDTNPNADLSRYELGLCYIKVEAYDLADKQYQLLDGAHSPYAEMLWGELKNSQRR